MFIIERKDDFTQTKYISNILYRQSSKNIIEKAEEKSKRKREAKKENILRILLREQKKKEQRKEKEKQKKKIFAIKSVEGENVIDSRART